MVLTRAITEMKRQKKALAKQKKAVARQVCRRQWPDKAGWWRYDESAGCGRFKQCCDYPITKYRTHVTQITGNNGNSKGYAF